MRSTRFAMLLALALSASSTLPPAAAAQTEVGIPFTRQDAYILAFAAPREAIQLDMGETQLSTEWVVQGRVAADATIVDARGRPVPRDGVLPGMEVVVDGEKLRVGVLIHTLRLKTRLEDWNADVSGVFERLDGAVAVVDGRRVALDDGVMVQGKEQWRGRSFRSFNEMMLGSFVEVKGRRDAEGLLHVSEGYTWPNLFTNSERALAEALRQGVHAPQQPGGRVLVIGDDSLQLASNPALQLYVTRLGTRLVPRWMTDLSNDDPSKVHFRFYVVVDSTFNAAAYPDGTVIVHTGLLKMMQNEAQLAAVLGHEIGHVTYEHGRERFEQERTRRNIGTALGTVSQMTGVRVAMPVVRVGDVQVDMSQVARLGMGVLSNVYSRDRENEADRVGLFYMVQAGYDPREAPAIWRRLAEATKPKNIADRATAQARNFLFSSHPESSARARNLNREIAAGYASLDYSRLKTGAPEFRSAIAGLDSRAPAPPGRQGDRERPARP